MQLSDLTDFSKIQAEVNRISAGAAPFRLTSPADKDDSRKMLEGKLRARGIEDPEAFFKNVERAVKCTGIESPDLYECPPIADIAHLLIEETLNDLDRQKNMDRPSYAAPIAPKPFVAPASQPAPIVTGGDKGVEQLLPSLGLPTPVRIP